MGLNTLDGNGGDPGEAQRALSSAAISGVVMAMLFVILALLLLVPKLREVIREGWRKGRQVRQMTAEVTARAHHDLHSLEKENLGNDSASTLVNDDKGDMGKLGHNAGKFTGSNSGGVRAIQAEAFRKSSKKKKRIASSGTTQSFTCAQGDIEEKGIGGNLGSNAFMHSTPDVRIIDASPLVSEGEVEAHTFQRQPDVFTRATQDIHTYQVSSSTNNEVVVRKPHSTVQPDTELMARAKRNKTSRETVLGYTVDIDEELQEALLGLQNLGSFDIPQPSE